MTLRPIREKIYDGRSEVVSKAKQDHAKGILGHITQQDAQINTYNNNNESVLKARETQKSTSLVEALSLDPFWKLLMPVYLKNLSDSQLATLAASFDAMQDRVDELTDLEQKKYTHNVEALKAEVARREQDEQAA